MVLKPECTLESPGNVRNKTEHTQIIILPKQNKSNIIMSYLKII
jgi:hypothetical protein